MSENRTLPAIKGWTPQQVEAIRRTVAYGASDEELTMFLYLAHKTGLDPFSNEIWFIQMNGKNKIMTGRDGYLKIANNHPAFQGMESDAIYEFDKFTRSTSGQDQSIIEHSYDSLKDRGRLLGAYAKVWRSDRKVPSFFLAPMSDYDKKKGCWLQYPHAMIIKVAEAMALKRAFAISGLCTQEELIPENHEPNKAQAVRRGIIWRDFVRYFNNDEAAARTAIESLVGVRPSATWTEEDLGTLEDFLLSREIIETDVINE